jgi:Ecdysteroid kinase-like family
MRFIDFQIVRYGPPTSDLVYFLYTTSNKEFREKYEADLLRAYVEAFNAEACVTPDVMDHDKLVAHFERARYFGMVISLGMRPMLLLPEFQPPSEGGEISDEFLEGMKDMNIKIVAPALTAFDNDDFFNKELRELISHSMAVMHKYVYPA